MRFGRFLETITNFANNNLKTWAIFLFLILTVCTNLIWLPCHPSKTNTPGLLQRFHAFPSNLDTCGFPPLCCQANVKPFSHWRSQRKACFPANNSCHSSTQGGALYSRGSHLWKRPIRTFCTFCFTHVAESQCPAGNIAAHYNMKEQIVVCHPQPLLHLYSFKWTKIGETERWCITHKTDKTKC